MMYSHDYHDAMELIRKSKHHKNWGDDLIKKYVEEPLGIRQYEILRDSDMIPLMFATWAFPNDKQVEEYTKTKYFPQGGYKGGGSDIWIVDFIAEKGYTRKGFVALKKRFMRSGYRKAFWFKPEKNKLRWHEVTGI
jgi:hemolysin-activating ACP:hemolysin acyltransferase